MNTAIMLREIRRRYVLSQRELAELSGLGKSTIGRLESGECADPTIGTLTRILGSVGLRIAVLHGHGREFVVPGEPVEYRMRDGRRLPAHLRVRPICSMQTPWWGWFRIAWMPDNPRQNPAVPAYTYDWRPDPEVLADPGVRKHTWDEAT